MRPSTMANGICISVRAVERYFLKTRGTFLEGLKKPLSGIVKVLKARSEGLGMNAACRVFNICQRHAAELGTPVCTAAGYAHALCVDAYVSQPSD